MSLETILLFALTEFLLCLTPGPAVIFVVGLAMRRGGRAGIAAGAGVTAGTIFYFVLSGLGIGALIVASHTLFTVLKWVGAAYLLYLGARMIVPLARALLAGKASPLPQPAPAAPVPRLANAFWGGFGVQAANPKTLMFFLALFPQFIAPEGNVALQFAIMAVISAAIEMPILAAYAILSAASAKVMRQRLMLWFEGAAGAVLMLLGAALAAGRSR